MNKRNVLILEEVFNSITHGLAIILLFVGVFFLWFIRINFTFYQMISVIVFIFSLFILYLFSSLYHSLFFTKAKNVFAILDKSAIYLLIAGTYTPFVVFFVNNPLGYIVLTFIWIMAIFGIVYSAINKHGRVALHVLLYLIMGWISLVFLHRFLLTLKGETFGLILLGGLLYTVGIIFFIIKRIPFSHVIWHIFVITGSFCHFLALYKWVN